MKTDIKCISCGEILGFGTMTKQSTKQSLNWKVMLGLSKPEWVPTCEKCGKKGKNNFCCPKCDSKEIWAEDILSKGNLIHKCNE